MTKATKRNILKAIDCDKLDLHKGYGYLYFAYDDIPNNIFHTKSVMVPFLNRLSLDRWISAGKECLAEVAEL